MLSLFGARRGAGADDGAATDEVNLGSPEPPLLCGPAHVLHCWDVLAAAFAAGSAPDPVFDGADGLAPYFVTLKKRRYDGTLELRGCIGTLSPRQVAAIGVYARKSAFEDRRFPPLTADELPQLEVSVSLLVGFEPAAHPHDWVVGVHGITIAWTDGVDGRQYSATYLPEVAPEQGWDQAQAVASLARKAGHYPPLSPAVLGAMTVTRYRSSKFSLSHAEWAAARGGAGGSGGKKGGASSSAAAAAHAHTAGAGPASRLRSSSRS